MAHYTTMVGVRDQLLAFIKDAMGSSVHAASWTTDLLYGIPEEAAEAGKVFPLGAVLWTLDELLLDVAPQAAGLIDSRTLTLWVCFTAKSTVSSVAAQDAAVALGQTALNALRASSGQMLSYGGNTASEGVAVPRLLISRTREGGKSPGGRYWVATCAIRCDIKNTWVES